MSSNKTKHIVQNFLQHLAQRDLLALTDMFCEKIDWYIPGDEKKATWLGKRTSKQGVKDFYETLWNNTEPISAKVDNIFIEDKNAVITGEFATKMLKTNKIVNSLFCIQITIENDLIVKYRLLEDSHAVSVSLNNQTN